MKYSPVLRWSTTILLPLTIAWKLTVSPENPIEIQNAVVGFFVNQHFDVSVTSETMEYMSIIEASSEQCRLHVARISPLGYEADLVRRLGTRTDRTYFLFRGTVYGEQPVWLTVTTYLWFRFLRELGLVSHIPAILAVVSSCSIENLPWGALRSL